MNEKPVVTKLVDEKAIYFTVRWSHLRKVDKYEINGSVPSEAGIYELYSMDHKGKLNLFALGKSWYGGLRNELRFHTDAELETDPERRKALERFDCYYRYSLVSNADDMTDILYFFAKTYFPGSTRYAPSARFESVFVKEISSDKIVTI